MTGHDDDDYSGTFASPPCFMHEVDPAYTGASDADDRGQRNDVMRWRKAERMRLMDKRLSIGPEARRRYDERIAEQLEAAIGCIDGLVVGGYRPLPGEPNLHPFLKGVVAHGGACALPVVIAPDRPLVFRLCSPDEPLARCMEQPVSQVDALTVIPDVILAPVIGFDRACHRLGYGGGFYDRTLAAKSKPSRNFGVSYMLAVIPTIYPQWYDIPLDAVITEDGVVTPLSNTRDGTA
ncbi:MAG: 5-formyltetrahydrofolate cyclo-ligase [Alphaproteobacteria bacterium HGW-Alphaproteobacteria-12]|nr:MAG: 5-formyltetrahydrofolate cyclo-ligase [Alphaproteobacteria bacterium HGW-Alphaproteobacteria-12]